MNNITVIGTEPPCPRCRLLRNIILAKIDQYRIITEFKHLSYLDKESIKFAESIGLEAGTAKDVAKKLNLEINSEELSTRLKFKSKSLNPEYEQYNNCNWSFELDEFLRPFENKAKDVGILMTPVLIINGKLMHQGSVPKMEKIEEWLDSLY